MNIESICRAIDQLAQLAQGWRAEKSISAIERDIALERIKPLYEALRFGEIEAAPTEEIVAEAPDAPEVEIDFEALTFEMLGLGESDEVVEQSEESEDETAEVNDPEVEVELIFDSEESEKIEESDGDEEGEVEVELLFEEEDDETDETDGIEETEETEETDGTEEVEELKCETETPQTPEPTPMSRHDLLLSLYSDEPQRVEQLSIDLYADEQSDESEEIEDESELEVSTLEIEEELDVDEEDEISTPQTTIVEVLDFDHEDEKDEKEIESELEVEVIEEVQPREQVFNINDYTPEIEDITIEPRRATTSEINSLFEVEPLPTEVESMGDVMGRMIGGELEVETISDRFASQNSGSTIFGEFASAMPTLDLTRDVNINDRYLIAQELFGGDMEACGDMLLNLNMMENFDDSMIYIVENFNWDPEAEATKLILSLLERKFSE